jgi:uncharacterized RDD family membrane protein YckC
VAAAVADYGLVGVYIGLLTLAGASARAAGLLPEQPTTQSARWAAQLASIGLLTMPVTLWLACWEAAPRGATPGKRLLGLHVVAANGGAVSLGRSLAAFGAQGRAAMGAGPYRGVANAGVAR